MSLSRISRMYSREYKTCTRDIFKILSLHIKMTTHMDKQAMAQQVSWVCDEMASLKKTWTIVAFFETQSTTPHPLMDFFV